MSKRTPFHKATIRYEIMKALSGLIIIILMIVISACAGNDPAEDKITNFKPDFVQGSRINVQLGVGYMKRGQYKIAKEKLEKAIKQDPDNVEAYTTIALLMNMLKEFETAEDYYLQALDLDDNNSELHNNYGTFLCSIGREDEALDEFKLAYGDPFYETNYIARSNAGSCMVKKGDYIQAEPLLRQALRTDDKLSGALISMAEIGVKTSKFLMSRAYIQRYHAINKPSSESLWIQIQAEKGLNDEKYYMKFARQLLKEFPDSAEAGLLQDSARDNKPNPDNSQQR